MPKCFEVDDGTRSEPGRRPQFVFTDERRRRHLKDLAQKRRDAQDLAGCSPCREARNIDVPPDSNPLELPPKSPPPVDVLLPKAVFDACPKPRREREKMPS